MKRIDGYAPLCLSSAGQPAYRWSCRPPSRRPNVGFGRIDQISICSRPRLSTLAWRRWLAARSCRPAALLWPGAPEVCVRPMKSRCTTLSPECSSSGLGSRARSPRLPVLPVPRRFRRARLTPARLPHSPLLRGRPCGVVCTRALPLRHRPGAPLHRSACGACAHGRAKRRAAQPILALCTRSRRRRLLAPAHVPAHRPGRRRPRRLRGASVADCGPVEAKRARARPRTPPGRLRLV